MSDLHQRISEAIANPKNLGEMRDADAVGTAGSDGCGDMLRMWVKFREEPDGRKVIDKASFQTFGCETAIAVASVATELLAGKTITEALDLSGTDLASPLGALPPMKIHCAQLVEGALRSALLPEAGPSATPPNPTANPVSSPAQSPAPSANPPGHSPTLRESLSPSTGEGKPVKIVFKKN